MGLKGIKTIVAASCLIISGCSAGITYIIDNYKGVEIQYFEHGNDTYRIFDKPQENRMMITPSLGSAAGAGMVKGLTLGLASAVPPGPVFEEAAAKFLEKAGRICTIRSSSLLAEPQFEIKYECKPDAKPKSKV